MLCEWLFSKKDISPNIELPTYPCEVTNASRNKKWVENEEEHLAFALAAKLGNVATKMAVAGYPVERAFTDDARLLHTIYIDTKRWGISFYYPNSDSIPNLVLHYLGFIASEYDRLEAEEIKSSSNNPKGGASK